MTVYYFLLFIVGTFFGLVAMYLYCHAIMVSKVDHAILQTEKNQRDKIIEELNGEFAKAQVDLNDCRNSINVKDQKITELNVTMATTKESIEQYKKDVQEMYEQMKVQFQNTSNELLTKQSGTFGEQTSKAIGALLEPFKTEINAINTTIKEEVKSKATLIPVPSIHEQKRIVAILDKAFAAIDKAKANAEQNLKNARELFESCAQMLFKNGNWKHKSIEEVCDDIFAGGDAPKGNFSPKKNAKYQIPIYANSVKDRGLYGYTDFSRVTTPSLTISARGSGTGHTEIRLERYLPIVRLIVLIPKLPLMNLDFLKYSIDNLEIMRSGSAIPQLTVPMIKKYKIPLPSITEQREIVQQLQALCNQTKKSEEIYKVKINKLEELKTSILQKAFSGELTSASAEVALA